MHFLDFQKSFSLRHCGLASACPARRPYISKSSVEQPLSSIGPSKVEKASLGGAKMFGTSCSRLGSNRINDLQKRELMKIGIAGTDLPNAMLAHENCRMRIMQQITGEMR
jgi:hypothetical protein